MRRTAPRQGSYVLPRIERQRSRAYVSAMGSSFLRLVVLIVLALMPLQMSAAPAAVSHAPTHEMAMSMKHCPDQQPRHKADTGFAACTMVCAAALPAGEVGQSQQPIDSSQLKRPLAADRLHGVLPEIATPPPKQS